MTQQLSCSVTDTASAVGTSSSPATLTITSSTSGPPSGGALAVTASATPNPVPGGQSSTFSCSASGGTPPYNYAWTVPGLPGSIAGPQVTYPTTNVSTTQTAQIACTASDSGGHNGTSIVTLTINPSGPPCPSMDFTVLRNGFALAPPMASNAGETLVFSVSSGFAAGSAPSYKWDFGDGSPTVSGADATYETHAFTAAGTYTVTLQPTNSLGLYCGGKSYQITVAGPSGNFTPSYDDGSIFVTTNVTAGKVVRFTAAEPSADSYDWDFGDGTAHGTGPTVLHIFAAGTPAVTLHVSKGGATATSTPLTLTVIAPPEPPKWVVPGMAYVQGQVAGTTWQSDVTIMNPSTLAATYSVALLDARHPVTDYSQLSWTTFTVPALGTISDSNVLPDVFGQPLGAYGALMVRGDLAPLPPVITARTFNNGDPTKGTFGLSVPQSSVAGGVSTQAAPAASVLIGLKQNAAAYTNLGLVNLHNDWATVELDFSDGTSAADLGTLTVQINPYQSYQINKALQDGRLVAGAGFFGTNGPPTSDLYTVKVKVLEGTAVYPYATVIDTASTDATVVTPTASPSNSYRLPGIVRLTGANGEKFRSRVTISNPSFASRTVHLVFSYVACKGGVCANPTTNFVDVKMSPAQTQTWDDFVRVWLTANLIPVDDAASYQTSFLDVSPAPGDTNSDPLVVIGETYNDLGLATDGASNGHVGLQIPGYTPLDGASSTGAYKRLALTGLASTASTRSNLVLFVIGGATGKWANIHLYSPEGTLLRSIPVPVDGFTVSNGTLFSGLSGDLSRVSAVIDNIDAGVTVGAYATIIDNKSGDSTFVRATPVP